MGLHRLLLLKKSLEEAAEEYHIEGVIDRINEASKNYQIANWRDYPSSFNLILVVDSLEYGTHEGLRYMQDRIDERKEWQ